jgi:outer membrane protein OmpA-like peptidoglycan-associated protein
LLLCAIDTTAKQNANSEVTMPTSRNVHDAAKQPALLRVLHLVRGGGIGGQRGRFWNAASAVAWIFGSAVLLFSASGCLATRNWVQQQLNPIGDRLGQQQDQLKQTDAKADQALSELQNLQLERKLVLDDSGHGPTFATGSAVLSQAAKSEIVGFLRDLEGSATSGSTSGRLFVVAGHTDSVGSESYNYELGQRRASRVAGYLVSQQSVDPTQLRVVSYGASKPVADNSTASGRRSNRRVEILVYQEKIVTGS